jgi:large subunit ribosomal protein L4
MATVPVKNMKGENVGECILKDEIFAVDVNEHAVHAAVVQYLTNQRQGTKSTKTRAEVRGGGAKPWRQKGTGRARQGSRRAPQWTGGGVAFAPKPRDFSQKLNKKIRRIALKSVLTSKVTSQKMSVLDDLTLSEIKTKTIQNVFNNLKTEKAFVVLEAGNRNAVLSARNIPGIKTAGVNTLNVYDILNHEWFIVTQQAVETLQEVYS